MTESKLRSFAKLNLHLAVTGRLGDGYHELRTVFQTIDLHDLVVLRRVSTPGVRLTVPGGGAPEGEANLAHRAASRLLAAHPVEGGVEIELVKRIPVGGGLGGGSSNAAAVLEGVDALLELGRPLAELEELGASLGADVPYFLTGGTALGTGRGDRIEALPEMPSQEVILALPGIAVSTAEVFAALEKPEPREDPPAVAALLAGEAPEGIGALGGWNDLERPVLDRYKSVRDVYNALRRAGADCVRLSGSGGTVFASFPSGREGEKEEIELPEGARLLTARTLSRSALARRRTVETHDQGS